MKEGYKRLFKAITGIDLDDPNTSCCSCSIDEGDEYPTVKKKDKHAWRKGLVEDIDVTYPPVSKDEFVGKFYPDGLDKLQFTKVRRNSFHDEIMKRLMEEYVDCLKKHNIDPSTPMDVDWQKKDDGSMIITVTPRTIKT